MKDHKELNDRDFVELFSSMDFPFDLFNHEAHLRLAYIHIKKSGTDKAVDIIRYQLKEYVEHLGVPDIYHETLTVASIKAVDHFIRENENRTFNELIEDHPELMTDFRSMIQSHYSMDIFNSPEARAQYLEPDIQDFD
jgi:hypothetical protein